MSERGTDTLGILLIEDNPGDARLIEERLKSGTDHLGRIDLDGSAPERARIHRADTLDAGLDRLSEVAVDVVLLDLGLPDSDAIDTLARVLEQCEFTPVVVLTGLEDQELGVEAIQRGAKDYLVKNDVTDDGLVRSIRHAIERTQRDRERARYREELEALARLNRIGQDVIRAVISGATREELERAVCDRFVQSEAYRFAWIGEIHRPTGRLSPRISAPADPDFLDDAAIPVGDGSTVEGPEARALRIRETCIVRDIQRDPAYEPIREELHGQEFRSVAALPVAHEGVFYGVFALYATSATAFSDAETEVLEQLCDVVGHALAAIERRDAIVEDTVLQLEFDVEGVAEELVALSVAEGCRFEFRSVIRTEGDVLLYGRVDGAPVDTVRDVVSRSAFFDDFDVLDTDCDRVEFEAPTSVADALVTAVVEHGGRVSSGRIADGEFRFVVDFPSGRDKHELVDLVERNCSAATIRAQRTVQREGLREPEAHSVFRDRLTDKQQNAIEAAFESGYFEWPRRNSGEEVASRLDISQATFSQHLRAAERKFFAAVFESDESDERDAGSTWRPLRPGTDGN